MFGLRMLGMALVLVTMTASVALAQMTVETEELVFPAGEDTVTIHHTIVGQDVYGYTFSGKAGQSVTVALEAVTPSANFTLSQSEAPAALYSSMTGDKTHTEVLPADDQYEIRLFLVGQAAETGSSDMTVTVTLEGGSSASTNAPAADFADGMMGGPDYWQVHGLTTGDTLNVRSGAGTDHPVVGTVRNGDVLRNFGCAQPGTTIWCEVETTDGSALHGWASNAYLREGSMPAVSDDALVEGTNYHAIGVIPCVIEADASVANCQFGVTRGQPGMATVFITLPNGFVRVISFADSDVRPMSAVQSFDVSRAGDETTVTIDGGAEIYTIPDAVIFGG